MFCGADNLYYCYQYSYSQYIQVNGLVVEKKYTKIDFRSCFFPAT